MENKFQSMLHNKDEIKTDNINNLNQFYDDNKIPVN